MNWFVSRRFDLIFFHLPVWLVWFAAFLIPPSQRTSSVPLWVWVCFVLTIDVGHVWSSIYRTWLDPDTRRNHARLLRWLPPLCLVFLLLPALYSENFFWSFLAYLALYHFIKQQIGFTALYRTRSFEGANLPPAEKQAIARIDRIAIYVGTGFPVIYWHFSWDRVFNWFIPGDFYSLSALRPLLESHSGGTWLIQLALLLFYGIWIWAPLYWFLLHLRLTRRFSVPFPSGKLLWVLGTWLNWFLGIVYFNSDLIFTLSNVVAHGVPYYALIGIYCHRKLAAGGFGPWPPRPPATGPGRLPFYGLFLIPILMLALSEEYLWNLLLYREHGDFFQLLWAWPHAMVTHPAWRALWVALLSLPQVLHYLLDGLIWKFNSSNPDLAVYLLPKGKSAE